ncbi:beta-defensin 113 [Peromyscus californicus insignis]|uniref:beta-defensin 113 n=1 Tax=Peromyscus californicus insignis TaxID=564181 RepID=UPI0022A7770F|nr:beta-defensin 113 [Peromyscus californicus insignis]
MTKTVNVHVSIMSDLTSAPQMKTRQIAERTHKCYLVSGSCKTECKAWEYVYNYYDIESRYVVCKFQKPIVRFLTSPKATT